MFMCLSTDLKDPVYLEGIRRSGYNWIRVRHQDFYRSLRNPTVGRLVELFKRRQIYCVHINSEKGRRIIQKLCYYI
jgi:hypothetical protein